MQVFGSLSGNARGVICIAGYYLWDDWPDRRAFVGTGLIIARGLLVVYLEKRVRRISLQYAQIDY